MFEMNQSIFLADSNNDIQLISQVPLNEIPSVLFSLLNDNDDIEEIEFRGNRDFITPITETTLKDIKSRYSNRNVRVNINGKVFN